MIDQVPAPIDWDAILAEYRQSGLSRPKFAQTKGISVQQLNYRVKKATDALVKSVPSSFMMVRPSLGSSTKHQLPPAKWVAELIRELYAIDL